MVMKAEQMKDVEPLIQENVIQVKKSDVKKDKIAFVGFAPSTLYEVNDLDETWDVMGMNELYKLGMPQLVPPGSPILNLSKFTYWMEIHSRAFDKNGKCYCDDVNTKTPQGKAHIENLNQMPFPVYMRKKDMEVWNDVKSAVAFPFEEITNFFEMKYFTNTVSWMIGWAVYENLKGAGVDVSKPASEAIKGMDIKEINKKLKWKKIAIYGVDMAVGWYKRSNGDAALQNEYASQRPSCEALIGWVKGMRMAGMDIDIYIPPKSSLMKKYSLYGFEDVNPELGQQKIDMIERLDFLDKQKTNLTNNMNAMFHHYQSEINKMKEQQLVLQGTISECEMQLSHLD